MTRADTIARIPKPLLGFWNVVITLAIELASFFGLRFAIWQSDIYGVIVAVVFLIIAVVLLLAMALAFWGRRRGAPRGLHPYIVHVAYEFEVDEEV